MADSIFNYEIERFITPIRGLYKEYIISVDDLRVKNPELFKTHVVDNAPVHDGRLIYELYGDGEEGEIVKEQVQTWICDNRQDVTRAAGITLRAKELSFSSWFRASEENRSPDELIVYCLSKMYKKHTVILNKRFAWSTLSNYISYTDLEIVQQSSIILIYVSISKYAVLKPSWTVKPSEENTPTPTKSRKRKAPAKITCRSGNKRSKRETAAASAPTSNSGTGPVKRTRTLAEKRLNQYGIGGISTRTTRKKQVDYLKLNDGLGDPENEPTSPRPKKKRSYVPSRSGPSSTRQRAQTTITSPPAQVLPCVPAKKTATLLKKLSNSTNVEPTPSGVQSTLNNIPVRSTTTTQLSVESVSGVQTSVSGVHSTLPGVHANTTVSENEAAATYEPSDDPVSGVHAVQPPDDPVSGVQAVQQSGVNNGTASGEATSGALSFSVTTTSADTDLKSSSLFTNDDKLPDLVSTSNAETDSYSVVLDTVPPVGDHPPDNIFDGGTTEEEFDAVDALLSLSTVRDNATDNSLEENATLMPIGGNSVYQDVNPVTMHLDQVSVDGEIAKIVQEESIVKAVDNGSADKKKSVNDASNVQQDEAINPEDAEQPDPDNTPVSGVQNTLSGVQATISGIQNNETNNAETDPVVEGAEDQKPKGYVKVTTHGIRKKTNSDSRSYRCSICGIRKRSAHNLNVHHKKRHSAQMCGVCGKVFDLASSLSHHMYTHNERRFFCEKCPFHCHFESELKKHNISHHSQPSHQCMKRNCGRWFKRKSDLVLHLETHKKDVLDCDQCDFTTKLQKYLKEHKKSHENTLPYSCNICGKRFLWRSGVRAHKTKEHSDPKT